MANTYTQIHMQFIFVVKFREGSISSSWKDELYKYITGIVQNHDHRMICINGMPDHIHLFIGMRPTQSVADLLREIKTSSSRWINERKLVKGKFEWQSGYAAFSYSKSHVPRVINYIEKQEQHHRSITFNMEYKEFLKENEIEYNERFVFQELV